jgi:hypothetical protein
MNSRKQLPFATRLNISNGGNFVRAQGTCDILPIQKYSQGAALEARGERQ